MILIISVLCFSIVYKERKERERYAKYAKSIIQEVKINTHTLSTTYTYKLCTL
jgi:hypothetical protein